jgi:hypothetical protein
MLRPRNCAASIQLSFGKKETRLKRKRGSRSPNSKFILFKSNFDGNTLGQSKSSLVHFAKSMCMAIKPPTTYSPYPSHSSSSSSHIPSSHSSGVNPSNIDVNTRVSYDDHSNVYIEIESYNISSLRASINSYLRLADASYKCIVEGELE